MTVLLSFVVGALVGAFIGAIGMHVSSRRQRRIGSA
jgi:hypothetical protein